MDWNGTGKKPPAEHIAFVVYNFLQRFTRKTTGSWEDVVGLELDDKYPISFQPLRHEKRRDDVGFSHSVSSFEQI